MLAFDSRGFLTPAGKSASSLDELKEFFVLRYKQSSKRQVLFNELLKFFRDFFETISVEEVTIWANGSFISKKENPNDIDFVFFLDYMLADQFESEISRQFTHPESKTIYQMDAYLLRVFPEHHPNHFFTESDKAWWFELFSNTRKNRAGRSDKKGFVEIKISRHEV